jgi:hypothetical protein
MSDQPETLPPEAPTFRERTRTLPPEAPGPEAHLVSSAPGVAAPTSAAPPLVPPQPPGAPAGMHVPIGCAVPMGSYDVGTTTHPPAPEAHTAEQSVSMHALAATSVLQTVGPDGSGVPVLIDSHPVPPPLSKP